MGAVVLICGQVFDGVSDTLMGPVEILIEDKRITRVGRTVDRPPGAQVIDLSERTVSPGFIDTHVHLTMDAAHLAQQTLESAASKALKALSLARQYMTYGFTTLRDLGSVDPDWPTVDLRNALDARLVDGPRLVVAAHILSASAGHGDLRGFYASRWTLPVSALADDPGSIKALVRREHTFGSDWIKTTNTGGYFSQGDDPARVTWFVHRTRMGSSDRRSSARLGHHVLLTAAARQDADGVRAEAGSAQRRDGTLRVLLRGVALDDCCGVLSLRIMGHHRAPPRLVW
jgi:imidazolonepropionase-like amidohydrolase